MTLTEVNPRDELVAFVELHANKGQAAVALGISATFLSMMLSGKESVSPRVLKHLGLRRTVVRKARKRNS